MSIFNKSFEITFSPLRLTVNNIFLFQAAVVTLAGPFLGEMLRGIRRRQCSPAGKTQASGNG